MRGAYTPCCVVEPFALSTPATLPTCTTNLVTAWPSGAALGFGCRWSLVDRRMPVGNGQVTVAGCVRCKRGRRVGGRAGNAWLRLEDIRAGLAPVVRVVVYSRKSPGLNLAGTLCGVAPWRLSLFLLREFAVELSRDPVLSDALFIMIRASTLALMPAAPCNLHHATEAASGYSTRVSWAG